MRAKATALLLVLVLAIAQPGLGCAIGGTAPAAAPDDTAAWWTTWSSDSDRDGVHDLLEQRALAAPSPSTPLDLVVDYSRAVRPSDVSGLEALGLQVQYVSRYADAVLGSAPAGLLGRLCAVPDVVMLEAQGVGVPVLASAGPSVGLDKAHQELGYTGNGVTIAVLDTGMRGTHVSLDDLDDNPVTDDPKIVVFYDAYANQTAAPYDSGAHGTWTASIAAGTGGGTTNVGGAPGARLVGVRAGSESSFPESTALRAMEWTIDHRKEYNISVMSISWGIVLGGPADHNGNSAISRTADRAVQSGMSVVVAAGNTALSATVTAPGDARNVVTVGSVNDNHHLSTFSSEGPTSDGRTKPDVCAPGESVTGASSTSDNGWYTGDGTSASAPLVGGLIACMMEANPDLTPAQVKQILHETSEHNTALSTKYLMTPNNGYGWGVVDAVGAVLRAKDLRAPHVILPDSINAGEDVPVEVRGSYTRTQHTDRGQDGRSPLGEDDVELTVTVPSDWDRPTGATYTMDGTSLKPTVVPDPISQSGSVWRIHVTFRVRTGVSAPVTAYPTVKFTTRSPLSVEGATYNMTAREALNTMQGTLATEWFSVGGNVPPTIQVIEPAAGTQYADASFTIKWTDTDPDDNALVSLYSDTDADPSAGLVLIASGIAEDPDGEGDAYSWDTSTLQAGSAYYVRATVDDGSNPVASSYSAGTITVRHTGNAPPTVEVLKPDAQGDTADRSYVIQYLARDPDDTARVDLYWDVDSTGYDGAAIATGLAEADGPSQYTWDTTGQPDAAKRWVYAVVSDPTNPPARAYSKGPLTIDHQSGPRVLDHSPVGTGVAIDEPVRVTFSTDMDQASVRSALAIAPFQPGTVSWVGSTMRYDPGYGWAPMTTYAVTIAGTAKDSSGREMGTDFRWQFTTGDAPIGPTEPSVTIVSPREGDIVVGDVWVEGTSRSLGTGGVVDVRIDGGPWQQASGNEQWSLRWDSTADPDGRHAVYARGIDTRGHVSPLASVNVTSENVANLPPVAQPVPDATVVAGETLDIQVEAADPNGDSLHYSDTTPLFEIDPTSGLISFRPYDGQVGTYPVTVAVTDGRATAYVTFNVTVKSAKEHGVLALPPWLGPLQLGILVAAAIAGIAAAVALRRSAERKRRRAAAHKIKVASKANILKGETT